MQVGGPLDVVDAYRTLHGYRRQEFSWFLRRGATQVGRRFDHVFCSQNLKLSRCEYLHELRDAGLSDHAPLEVDFAV